MLLPDDLQRGGSVGREQDLVALQIEGTGERIADGAVVVDQEHSVRHANHLVA